MFPYVQFSKAKTTRNPNKEFIQILSDNSTNKNSLSFYFQEL